MSGLSSSSPPATAADDPYDRRYLAGIVHFNRGEYFEAHEVWEEIWMDCPGTERRFYQSLIQAAVALYHWGNGNRAGASRLFHSGRKYMAPYRPAHLGLVVEAFWAQVEQTLAPALHAEGATEPLPMPGEPVAMVALPAVVLSPPPAIWPDVHSNDQPTPGTFS